MGADDNHIITRRLSVKRKYTADISDQESRISERQLNKVNEIFQNIVPIKSFTYAKNVHISIILFFIQRSRKSS